MAHALQHALQVVLAPHYHQKPELGTIMLERISPAPCHSLQAWNAACNSEGILRQCELPRNSRIMAFVRSESTKA